MLGVLLALLVLVASPWLEPAPKRHRSVSVGHRPTIMAVVLAALACFLRAALLVDDEPREWRFFA